MKKMFKSLVFIAFLASTSIASAHNPSSNLPLKNQIEYHQANNKIELVLSTSSYTWEQVANGLQLSLPGSERFEQSGQPAIPVFSALVAIPPDGEILNEISNGVVNTIKPPAPMAVTSSETNIKDYAEETSEALCDQNSILQPVQVDAPAWIRDQRVMRVRFFPFRWDCQQQVWIYTANLKVDLSWTLLLDVRQKSTHMIESSLFDDVLKENLINYQSGLNWRGNPASSMDQNSLDFPSTNVHKDGSSSKMRITTTLAGIYQISYNDLQSAGMDMETIDPNSFLIENLGRKVSYAFMGDDDQLFEPGEALIFYAPEFDGSYLASLHPEQDIHWLTFHNGFKPQFNAEMVEKYTDNNVFWFSLSDDPSPRIEEIHQEATSPQIITNTTRFQRFEQDRRWWTYHFTSEETWFWEQNISVSNTVVEKSYPFELLAVSASSGDAQLAVDFTSDSANALNPDHHVEVYINNNLIKDETWDGAVWHTINVSFPQSYLLAGSNSIKIRYIPISGVVANRYAFDGFSVTYLQNLLAHDQHAVFTYPHAGDLSFSLEGFIDSQIHIWDINQPLQPIELLEKTRFETLLTYANHQTGSTNYYVFGSSAVLTPNIEKVDLPDLYSSENAADYLIITPIEFLDSLQQLVDWRTAQGLNVKVVLLQDIYDLFAFGIPHPIAIKTFIRYTFANWATAPQYVLLVGDGSWDIKNYQVPERTIIPPNFVWVDPVQGEIDSLSDLVAVIGDDILPDAMIGRLTVNNVSELETVVGKTIAFEQSEGDWLKSLSFTADNYYLTDGCMDNDPLTLCSTEPAGNFPALMNEFLADMMRSPFQPTKFYLDDYNCRSGQSANCEILTTDLINHINSTPSQIYVYTGHGSITGWAGEKVFNSDDLPRLMNSERFPVFFSLDCVDGFWYYPSGIASPNPISLAESITRLPNAGAAAMYAATGFSYSSAHDILQRGFFENFFRRNNTPLGAADLSAKLKVYASGNNDEMIFTYMIFGDPAMRLHNELKFTYLPLLSR